MQRPPYDGTVWREVRNGVSGRVMERTPVVEGTWDDIAMLSTYHFGEPGVLYGLPLILCGTIDYSRNPRE